MDLEINEVYYSIQGESSFVGRPCVFVRTARCSLRCRWCDTTYAFEVGIKRTFTDLYAEIARYQCPLVEVTGGEPLDQPNTYPFLRELCDQGYQVLIETGGHRPIEIIDPRVHIIMDLKCPSSKMMKRNRLENLAHLSRKDEVKFVIGNREDYEWAREMVKNHQLSQSTQPLFSPVFGELPPAELVEWIKADKLAVRFQLQLHKIIWDPQTKGV